MIIDPSYFVGEIHISQVGASASKIVNNNTLIERFIDQYEVEFINKAIGRIKAKEFFDNIDPLSGNVNADADIKWHHLMDGYNYTFCDRDYCWRGLRYSSGVLNLSVIAYYVYYRYMTDNIIQKSTMGMVRPDAENALNGSTVPTLTRAWRNMIEWYGDVNIGYGNYQYPTITYKHRGYILDYAGRHYDSDVSLYQFLTHNDDVYEDFVFTPMKNKNQFQL